MSAICTKGPVFSRKSSCGHTLGASGGVEAVISVLALRDQLAPPTLRLDLVAPDCPLDYVPHTPRPMALRNVLSNTFGSGGGKGVLLFPPVASRTGSYKRTTRCTVWGLP